MADSTSGLAPFRTVALLRKATQSYEQHPTPQRLTEIRNSVDKLGAGHLGWVRSFLSRAAAAR